MPPELVDDEVFGGARDGERHKVSPRRLGAPTGLHTTCTHVYRVQTPRWHKTPLAKWEYIRGPTAAGSYMVRTADPWRAPQSAAARLARLCRYEYVQNNEHDPARLAAVPSQDSHRSHPCRQASWTSRFGSDGPRDPVEMSVALPTACRFSVQ